jgi:hypothetical protein
VAEARAEARAAALAAGPVVVPEVVKVALVPAVQAVPILVQAA